MKKVLTITLVLFLLLPCIASAEGVLADGWENANLDGLLDAKQAISSRITQLIVHQEGTAEGFTLSGKGIEITNGYKLPAGLWRRVISIPQAELYEDHVIINKNGENESVTITDTTMAAPIQVSVGDVVDYVAVETDGKWIISYTPITADGKIEASGTKAYVSDCFTCTKPTMVNINVKSNSSKYSSFYVYLYYVSSSGRLCFKHQRDTMVSETMEKGQSGTYKAIIKPEDDAAAFIWVIECDDGVEWSITAQEH